MSVFRVCILSLCLLIFSQPGFAHISESRQYSEALLLLRQERFGQALALLKEISPGSSNPAIWFAQGVAAFRLHHLSEAYEAYQTGLKLVPPPELEDRLRGGLGDVYFELESYADAASAYELVLAHQHSWHGVRLKLASAYLRLQDYPAALRATESLLELKFTPAETHYLRSLIYLAQQNWQTAIAELQQLENYPAHRFEALQHLNWLFRMQKRLPEARQTADDMVKLADDYPQAYRLATLTLLEQLYLCLPTADCQELRQKTHQLLERWQLNETYTSQAYATLGKLHQLDSNWEAAEQAFSRAESAFPQQFYFHLKRLEMQAAQGKTLSASEWSLPLNQPFSGSIWQELSKWPQKIGPQLPPLQSQLSSENFLFWQAFFQHNWQAPVFPQAWAGLEKHLQAEEPRQLIQALRLWQAGERQWARKLLLNVREQQPEWWLPYFLLSHFYADQPAEAFRWRKVTYLLHPNHQENALALVQFQAAGEQRKGYLQKMLKTFPDNQYLQQIYFQNFSVDAP